VWNERKTDECRQVFFLFLFFCVFGITPFAVRQREPQNTKSENKKTLIEGSKKKKRRRDN
jgi:hypothetical protein